jgi:hypothetical protein
MTRPKSFKLLICILFGHDFKCRGFWRDTDYGPEHDEEWTCKRWALTYLTHTTKNHDAK